MSMIPVPCSWWCFRSSKPSTFITSSCYALLIYLFLKTGSSWCLKWSIHSFPVSLHKSHRNINNFTKPKLSIIKNSFGQSVREHGWKTLTDSQSENYAVWTAHTSEVDKIMLTTFISYDLGWNTWEIYLSHLNTKIIGFDPKNYDTNTHKEV